ncbi:cupin domain-containing protein [Antrihabitans spumae]|uniref:Cupin domain-containing protein n=1 Tax=Antrihabitans spumae TaxID=3373370 RepID=A0ABW7KQI4_9NOCA
MAVITAPTGPTHEVGGTRFTSLATPSRGSTDTSVWRVEIAPGTPATPHRLTKEEVFVVLAGTAATRIDGLDAEAATGESSSLFRLASTSKSPQQATNHYKHCAAFRWAGKRS